MTWFQLVLLSIIQGATEWLPISSSAHLILLPALTDLPDQGPLIDAMAHLGSLGAVIVYFWRDIAAMFRGALDLLVGREMDGARRRMTPESKLLLLIAIATPPGILAGAVYALTDLQEVLRSPTVIAVATIVFGLALWAADALRPHEKEMRDMTFRAALIVGLAQAIAFIPGTSRSGITMTAARALGFQRDEAARFAMLVGLPLIGASGAFALLELASGDHPGAIADDGTLLPVTFVDGLVVAGLSFLAAWASIAFLMALVKRMSFFPFVLYRLALGGLLLGLTL
ncbi:MAG: undecaprenyl-diphosphate phosphatase [Caulobacterales bacterium]|nr:undecaprenyl-diphosphate phosphatase [Caulobacterales bacterium]